MRKINTKSESDNEISNSRREFLKKNYPPKEDSLYYSTYRFWRWFRWVIAIPVILIALLIGGVFTGFNLLIMPFFAVPSLIIVLPVLFVPQTIITYLVQAEHGEGPEVYLQMVNKKRDKLNYSEGGTGTYQHHVLVDNAHFEETNPQKSQPQQSENSIPIEENATLKVTTLMESTTPLQAASSFSEKVQVEESSEYQRIKNQPTISNSTSKNVLRWIKFIFMLVAIVGFVAGIMTRNWIIIAIATPLFFLMIIIMVSGRKFEKIQEKIIKSKGSVTIKGIFTSMSIGITSRSGVDHTRKSNYTVIHYEVKLDGIQRLCRFSSKDLITIKQEVYDFYYNPKYPKEVGFVPQPGTFQDALLVLGNRTHYSEQ
jgi:hypothetical protein